ncbi:MAG: 16S rRNA (guanine(527)-N(7))-methyltransferase RsmG [Fibrobacteraceae bacterium]|nr:16S rRNA (guanine(527)-N(7))-methyltransferase RsmG [Fibrobacteraceae bacterium]
MANSNWSKKSFGRAPARAADAVGKDFVPHLKARRTEFPLFGGKRVNPSLSGLEKLLGYYGVELQPQTLEQIWKYHQLIRENNDDQDLTRLNAFETMVERHYADCTLINAFVKKWPARMIDVGSGAGFPGIPLKLVNPQINLTLCEPRPNRINFLNMVIEKLGLKNIDVFGHKVTSRSMTIPVDGVISRAFELMEKTFPRLENSLKIGGRMFFMKGPAAADELKTLHPEDFGYKLLEKHFYNIPNSTQERALVIFERVE